MDEYIKIINDKIDAKNIELVSQTNNLVFKVVSSNNEVLYAKFYLNKSTHIDHELYLYKVLDNNYFKDIVISSNNPKYAVFKELKGKTLDELTKEELEAYKEQIIDSLIYFYETVSKVKINNYGLLDNEMNGTSESFREFIVKRQTDTENILKDYPILNNAFSSLYNKYKNIIIEDNSLVPIDTNAKNIMVTDDKKIKFIDPGELISAPILMGYGDFVAHTYKTELYDLLIDKLNLSEDDLKRLRIYAIFSSLNILAFLKKLGVDDLNSVIPYGNTYPFIDLIDEHLKELDIKVFELKK